MEARELTCNPDLHGEFTWKFDHYEIPDGESKAVLSGKNKPKEVTIIGLPGGITHKRKIWWIHSSVGGMGKTTFLKHLENKFNAQIMMSGSNVTSLRKNVQLILFDETANLPDWEKFKMMTSGSCTVSFNRKMAGADFVPREDVQFIICANISPLSFTASTTTSYRGG